MVIQINGLDEQLLRPLQHIANLFFEQVLVSFTSVQQAEMEIEFYMERANGRYCVTGKVLSTENKEGTYCFTKDFKAETGAATADAFLKQYKRAVAHVFLLTLQKMTGITQEWGILTGIRPTKLLHRKLQSGMEKEEAHAQLQERYLLSGEKIALMQQVVDRQLSVVPDLYDLKREVSVYIGIPFCPTKCAYCTFPAYAIQGRQGNVQAFLKGLHEEIKHIGHWLKENDIAVTTVYFGGGTPTSITAEEMDQLYKQMYESFPHMDRVREITVEAGRPDTITVEKLHVLKKWKMDRISINPQSFIQETLKEIGRHHTVTETIEKYKLARQMGMTNINMDLIIGLPGEGADEFAYTLHELEKLLPESVTVHTLSFKRASEMTKNKANYKVAPPEEIQQMMDMATAWMGKHSYHPYYLYRQKNILGNLENIGYSQYGKESIYNILIMEEQQTIIGLGCGASSKFVHPITGKITRYANPKEPLAYEKTYSKKIADKIKILKGIFC